MEGPQLRLTPVIDMGGWQSVSDAEAQVGHLRPSQKKPGVPNAHFRMGCPCTGIRVIALLFGHQRPGRLSRQSGCETETHPVNGAGSTLPAGVSQSLLPRDVTRQPTGQHDRLVSNVWSTSSDSGHSAQHRDNIAPRRTAPHLAPARKTIRYSKVRVRVLSHHRLDRRSGTISTRRDSPDRPGTHSFCTSTTTAR
jgi:hypothetical protein